MNQNHHAASNGKVDFDEANAEIETVSGPTHRALP